MTATFTLTGRLFTLGNQPIVGAKLIIEGPPRVVDPTLNRVYTTRPENVVTDSAGNVTEAGSPGVTLLVGLHYKVRSIPPSALPPFEFDADASQDITDGSTRDIADILVRLAGGDGDDTLVLVADLAHPGSYLTTGLSGDTTYPGSFETTGLTADSAHPGAYLTGAA